MGAWEGFFFLFVCLFIGGVAGFVDNTWGFYTPYILNNCNARGSIFLDLSLGLTPRTIHGTSSDKLWRNLSLGTFFTCVYFPEVLSIGNDEYSTPDNEYI